MAGKLELNIWDPGAQTNTHTHRVNIYKVDSAKHPDT